MASGDEGADAVCADESDEMSYDSVEAGEYDDDDAYEDKEEEDDDEEEDSDEARTCDDGDKNADGAAIVHAAAWMSGKVGIAWRHVPGDTNNTKRFNVRRLVKDVQSIPGLSYVLFGLSGGCFGNKYIAPHSVLSKINPGSCPARDLFGELATAFQAAGYKVLVYMATEGPAQLKHGAKREKYEKWIENWKSYVFDKYGSNDEDTLKKAYAEVIVGEYARRYGDKIDGWWFDHGVFGNVPLLHDVCKKANPKTIMAYNGANLGGSAAKGGRRKKRGRRSRKKTLWNNNPFEDYTGGHPTPLKRKPPSDACNLGMVESIEATRDGFFYANGTARLGHMFMPMQEHWNRGKGPVWTEEQAVEWMHRVLTAGGAWTWNVPLLAGALSRLSPESNEFAKRVSLKLKKLDEGDGGDEL